jgi:hypothetical protein
LNEIRRLAAQRSSPARQEDTIMRSESRLKSKLSTLGLLIMLIIVSFLLAQLAIPALSSTASPDTQAPNDSGAVEGQETQGAVEDTPNTAHNELIAMPVHVPADALNEQGLFVGDRIEVFAVARGGRSQMPWASVISDVSVLSVDQHDTVDAESGNLRRLTLEMTREEAATVAFAADTGAVRLRRLN